MLRLEAVVFDLNLGQGSHAVELFASSRYLPQWGSALFWNFYFLFWNRHGNLILESYTSAGRVDMQTVIRVKSFT